MPLNVSHLIIYIVVKYMYLIATNFETLVQRHHVTVTGFISVTHHCWVLIAVPRRVFEDKVCGKPETLEQCCEMRIMNKQSDIIELIDYQ